MTRHTTPIRTIKKRIGKNDVQVIPIKAVTSVHHDRKTIGTDQVRLQVHSESYQWKVSKAEPMVAELNEKLFL